MTNRKVSGYDRTAAQRKAEAAFKLSMAVKAPSDELIAKKAFDDNRERLKAERLARDALVADGNPK